MTERAGQGSERVPGRFDNSIVQIDPNNPAEVAWANLLSAIYDEHGYIAPSVGAALSRYREAVGVVPIGPSRPD